jgi:hypothetical protein
VLAAIVLVLVVFVIWVVAPLRTRRPRTAVRRDRLSATTFVIGLPPVPAPQPRLVVPPIEPLAGALPRPVENVVLAPPVAVPRPVRRCGNCRAVGHTRPSCPRLSGALPLPHL